MKTKTIEESVLTAMDCSDKEILPYLPYILQDFWEIGSDPEVMINLIKKHLRNSSTLQILDLGCGKGAVSINIAKQLNCECYGIDAIPEFISFSALKADECSVGNLCKFEVGDIREKVKTLGLYDVIILGAIGQVFGNYFETLTILNNNLKAGGIILIDDGYIDDESGFKHEHVFSKNELRKQISDARMQLIDEMVVSEGDSVMAKYDAEYCNLFKRCKELSEKYPDRAEIFINYSNRQKNEYDNLKNEITCSTMVINRKE
jgi:cyclopropane fatty-acyl-phospholipid synthase-like methyltransferase